LCPIDNVGGYVVEEIIEYIRSGTTVDRDIA
jgi:hypothetical protein